MRGDIDGDGKITENDRNRINEHLGGTITLTGADSWCAKVTGNNEISASDLVQLMRYLEGKTNNLTGIPTFADYYTITGLITRQTTLLVTGRQKLQSMD